MPTTRLLSFVMELLTKLWYYTECTCLRLGCSEARAKQIAEPFYQVELRVQLLWFRLEMPGKRFEINRDSVYTRDEWN